MCIAVAVCFLANVSSLQADTGKKFGSGFRLQPGDRIDIQVFREDDMSGTYDIDPSGNLMFPLLGKFQAAGMEMDELAEYLTRMLKKFLVDPQVSVSRAEASIKSISVLGNVSNPGTFDFSPGATLMRLVSEAGGFAKSANKRKVRIVRLENDEKISITVNASDIINGKEEDVMLQPGDMIFVPESIF